MFYAFDFGARMIYFEDIQFQLNLPHTVGIICKRILKHVPITELLDHAKTLSYSMNFSMFLISKTFSLSSWPILSIHAVYAVRGSL